jgi:glycosyl transferase family 9 (putative heptosyltransferase)
LASTCSTLLELCLRGEPWPADLVDSCIAEDDGRALLSVVVERLGDLFEPRLCDVYARLFTQVIERAAPELTPRIRRSRVACAAPPKSSRVYVLSRVTLGADVAVTSVLIDAAKRRYPDAEIVFVGPRKSYEMFEADARVRHFEAPYARSGSLAERLRASSALWFDDGIVIDPDSRLTQLGLLAVCDPGRYFFFESRAYGSDTVDSLPDLASRWAHETFGIENARAFVAPLPVPGGSAEVTISLGVGENASKRLDDNFERELVAMVRERTVLIDKGGTPEERARVDQVLLPGMRTHDGAFAPFAAEIARSSLFIGYDSAGGHIASACGVPQICIFAGAVSERFFNRWKPRGHVIRGDRADALSQVRRFL